MRRRHSSTVQGGGPPGGTWAPGRSTWAVPGGHHPAASAPRRKDRVTASRWRRVAGARPASAAGRRVTSAGDTAAPSVTPCAAARVRKGWRAARYARAVAGVARPRQEHSAASARASEAAVLELGVGGGGGMPAGSHAGAARKMGPGRVAETSRYRHVGRSRDRPGPSALLYREGWWRSRHRERRNPDHRRAARDPVGRHRRWRRPAPRTRGPGAGVPPPARRSRGARARHVATHSAGIHPRPVGAPGAVARSRSASQPVSTARSPDGHRRAPYQCHRVGQPRHRPGWEAAGGPQSRPPERARPLPALGAGVRPGTSPRSHQAHCGRGIGSNARAVATPRIGNVGPAPDRTVGTRVRAQPDQQPRGGGDPVPQPHPYRVGLVQHDP